MLSKTIKTFLIIKILFVLFLPHTFANNIKPLQKGEFEFDTYYTFDFSRLTSGVYKDDKLKGKGKLYLPKDLRKDDKIPLNNNITYLRWYKIKQRGELRKIFN